MELGKLKPYIDTCDTICFDIFDTLVSRVCYRNYTRKVWASYVKELFQTKKTSQEIFTKRMELEQSLFQKNEIQYQDGEFQYQEFLELIYPFLEIEIPYKEFSKKCVELVTDIEKSAEYVKSGVVEVLHYCKEQEKRIICISDMYLSKTILEDIFKYHGLSFYFEKLYVSSDYHKSKRTGNLYEQVLKEENTNPENMLMIGDNYQSDFENAKKYGLKSCWVENKKMEEFYKKSEEIDNTRNIEMEFQILMKEYPSETKKEYEIYQFLKYAIIYAYQKNKNIEFSIKKKELEERWNFLEEVSWISLKENESISILLEEKKLILFDEKEISNISFEPTSLEVFKQLTILLTNKIYDKEKINFEI